MEVQRGNKQRKSKGRRTRRQKNLENRSAAYAKLVGFEGDTPKLGMLPKRFRGFTRPGSGKRT